MYFSGNVRYESQGLLSPRVSRGHAKRLHGIEFLRFLAAMHIVFWAFFQTNKTDGSTAEEMSKRARQWGFTGPNFFLLLSGFVLAYTYGPALDESRTGLNLPRFLLKRLAWLYPVFLVSLLLPIWAAPLNYLGKPRGVLKFLLTMFGLSGFYPPTHRTYYINTGAWVASSYLVCYAIVFPIFIKPIHTTLSRVARMWLLVFMWPWTWFVSWSAQKIDNAVDDKNVHWDLYLPVFYIPTFLMGVTAGSIFAERDVEGPSEGIMKLLERVAGLLCFVACMFVYLFADPDPLRSWHQCGSLSLIQVIVIYFFANGKDLLGMLFSLLPFRVLGGFAFALYSLQYASHSFARGLKSVDYDVGFSLTLATLAILAHFFVEIPYARWVLRWLDARDGGDAPIEHRSSTTAEPTTPKEPALSPKVAS